MSIEFISLSVQGCIFVVEKDVVQSFDWTVATMITTATPTLKHNNNIYINVDPISFRIILSVLQGLTNLRLEIARISTVELSLLKSTTTYLLCNEIVKEIEACQTEFQILKAERGSLLQQLSEVNNGPEMKIIIKTYQYGN